MTELYQHFMDEFRRAVSEREFRERRIGAELKFPLVKRDGTAADLDTVRELWRYLGRNGWDTIEDRVTGQIAGARIPGPHNDTIAACETGFCKTEFSLAHVADLFELSDSITALRKQLKPFSEEHGVYFLGYGIQPLTAPSGALLFKKERSCFWDQALPSNRHIPPEKGDDVHLFTVNACSHVHVSVEPEDAIRAVNVLNGLAGPQIALTAHSPVWQGRRDDHYLCVNEMLWDWWKPAEGRCGIPAHAFEHLKDYVSTIENLSPIYVKRDGRPILIRNFDTFGDYFSAERPAGKSLDGQSHVLVPGTEDIRVHNSCYWYTARISQYFTVENRVFDQQPPDELETAAALTLGILSALDDAWAEVARYSWSSLRQAREIACRDGLAGTTDEFSLEELAGRMLDIAADGLRRRGLGEEKYLLPLYKRFINQTCPAQVAAQLFEESGIAGLIRQLAL